MSSAEYLNSTVSAALTEAFASAARIQPSDAVDYVGKFLLQYASNVDRKEQVRQRGSTYPAAS